MHSVLQASTVLWASLTTSEQRLKLEIGSPAALGVLDVVFTNDRLSDSFGMPKHVDA